MNIVCHLDLDLAKQYSIYCFIIDILPRNSWFEDLVLVNKQGDPTKKVDKK